MADTVAIGRAAAELGIEPHVLRHWEDVGVLVPQRTSTGHRRYDDETTDPCAPHPAVPKGGIVAGRHPCLVRRKPRGAHRDCRHNRERIVRAINNLQRAEQFLAHVLSCVHPIVSECPECAGFANTDDFAASPLGNRGDRR
ncbi:MerR family transcriptional regulator [Mycobacterium noviomagense]|uniref:HTH merR-type domain-containing protein n=1 Tax=Mycobacterium noviomagense TaxID=459858 RepID=A0A7I7P9X4_9MYCO|nr:helix-turn-helix domain-containing protein [Mycobacterium noviomagense]BBY05387.1 hypothetical protein MNVI_07050 [Mycobacterium noviomagense]